MPLTTRLLLLTSILVPASIVPLFLFYRTTAAPGSDIRFAPTIPTILRQSRLIRLINPRGNPLMTDSWTYSIPRDHIGFLSSPGSSSSLSEDEEEQEVLARFVRGFFGGKAFTIEEHLLSSYKGFLRVDIDDPSNFELDCSRDKKRFWTWRQWSNNTYMPYGAVYLESFQLLDSGRDRVYEDTQFPRTYSVVAFGSNRPGRSFVGFHFFSVTRRRVSSRDPTTGEDIREGEDVYDLNLWSANCDPSPGGEQGSRRPRWLWAWIIPQFHCIYARVLLADAIDAVSRS